MDRFLPTPDGRVERLVFKEGPQIVFPPDAYDALREVASPPPKPRRSRQFPRLMLQRFRSAR